MTWVVEIFTTAGSTRFTIDANELEDGMASGTASGVAPLAERGLIAEVRPETTEPIKIPTISVSATNKLAIAFSRRAQLTISFTGSPIALAPVLRSATNSPGFWIVDANPKTFDSTQTVIRVAGFASLPASGRYKP